MALAPSQNEPILSAREAAEERIASARLTYDDANRAHSDATIRRNLARNRADQIRATQNLSAGRAHEAIDVLAKRADALFAAGVSEYVVSLAKVPSEPAPPPAEIASYFALRDKAFVTALHGEVDRVAADGSQPALIPDAPADLKAALQSARTELAECEAEVERTYAEQVDAANHLTAVENGHE